MNNVIDAYVNCSAATTRFPKEGEIIEGFLVQVQHGQISSVGGYAETVISVEEANGGIVKIRIPEDHRGPLIDTVSKIPYGQHIRIERKMDLPAKAGKHPFKIYKITPNESYSWPLLVHAAQQRVQGVEDEKAHEKY